MGDSEITAHERQISELNARLAGLAEKLADREAAIAALERQLVEKDRILAAMRRELAGQIELLRRRLADVYESTSWRVTGPLRLARRLLPRR